DPRRKDAHLRQLRVRGVQAGAPVRALRVPHPRSRGGRARQVLLLCALRPPARHPQRRRPRLGGGHALVDGGPGIALPALRAWSGTSCRSIHDCMKMRSSARSSDARTRDAMIAGATMRPTLASSRNASVPAGGKFVMRGNTVSIPSWKLYDGGMMPAI